MGLEEDKTRDLDTELRHVRAAVVGALLSKKGIEFDADEVKISPGDSYRDYYEKVLRKARYKQAIGDGDVLSLGRAIKILGANIMDLLRRFRRRLTEIF